MAYRLDEFAAPPGAIVRLSAGVKINAPADFVFNILLDVAKWPEWNSFLPSVALLDGATGRPSSKGIIRSNSKMILDVRMKPSSSIRKQKEVVTGLDQNERRVCWKAEGIPEFFLRGNRTNEFLELSSTNAEPSCEYRTFEWMTGPGAYIVRSMYGTDLQARFQDMANDLKRYAEEHWAKRSATNDQPVEA